MLEQPTDDLLSHICEETQTITTSNKRCQIDYHSLRHFLYW